VTFGFEVANCDLKIGAALPRSLRKASGFPLGFLLFEALPPRGVAANSLECDRKGKAFPQGRRQSRRVERSCLNESLSDVLQELQSLKRKT